MAKKRAFNFYQVMGLLKGSNVPDIHIRNNEIEAKHLAEKREEVSANGVTEKGDVEMGNELLRLMNHFQNEIHAIAKGELTPTLKHATVGDSFIWFARKRQTANRVPWTNLEVVIGRNEKGRFFLKHCQPNP